VVPWTASDCSHHLLAIDVAAAAAAVVVVAAGAAAGRELHMPRPVVGGNAVVDVVVLRLGLPFRVVRKFPEVVAKAFVSEVGSSRRAAERTFVVFVAHRSSRPFRRVFPVRLEGGVMAFACVAENSRGNAFQRADSRARVDQATMPDDVEDNTEDMAVEAVAAVVVGIAHRPDSCLRVDPVVHKHLDVGMAALGLLQAEVQSTHPTVELAAAVVWLPYFHYCSPSIAAVVVDWPLPPRDLSLFSSF
jgi:hypothetical protein